MKIYVANVYDRSSRAVIYQDAMRDQDELREWVSRAIDYYSGFDIVAYYTITEFDV